MSFTDGADDAPDNSFSPAQPGERQLSLPPAFGGGGSPIQNIVNFFRQQNPSSQPSNQPSPQAQPMQGRTPFILPGTNQPIDFPPSQPRNQSQPPPPAPNQPPPAPRGLSPLPPNFPQPKGAFTPYIPSQYDRHYSQWGTPDQFGMEPQTWETPHIAKGVGQFFAQFGSIPMMGIGRNLNQFADAYIKSYMQGKDFLAKQRMEDLAYNMKLAEYHQQQELTDYADIVDEYSAAAGTTDPDKLQNFTLNGVSMEQALSEKAHELNDPTVYNMVDAGVGVAKIVDRLHDRDKHLRDLQNANKASEKDVEKQAETNRQREAAGLPPEPTSTTGEVTGAGDPYSRIGQPAPPAAPVAKTQPPASAPPADDAGAPVAGEAPDPKAKPEADPNAATKPFQKAGDEFFRTGREDQVDKDPGIAQAEKNWARNRPQQISAIANNPNLTPDQKLARLRALNPSFADDALGYARYQKGPGATGGTGAATSQDYWDALAPMARQLNPTWSAGQFQVVNKYRDDAIDPNKPWQRIPMAAYAGKQVLADIEMIQKAYNLDPLTPIIDSNGNIADAVKDIAGLNPLIQQLKLDWQRYNQDVGVIMTGPNVTLTNEAIQSMPTPWMANITEYRAGVVRDMGNIERRAAELHKTWEGFHTGDPMPSHDPEAEKDISDTTLMHPPTGLMPGQSIMMDPATGKPMPTDPKTGEQVAGGQRWTWKPRPGQLNWNDRNNWDVE